MWLHPARCFYFAVCCHFDSCLLCFFSCFSPSIASVSPSTPALQQLRKPWPAPGVYPANQFLPDISSPTCTSFPVGLDSALAQSSVQSLSNRLIWWPALFACFCVYEIQHFIKFPCCLLKLELPDLLSLDPTIGQLTTTKKVRAVSYV